MWIMNCPLESSIPTLLSLVLFFSLPVSIPFTPNYYISRASFMNNVDVFFIAFCLL